MKKPETPEVIKNILWETGGNWESDNIKTRLKDLEVNINDIDLVLCSHGHSDHIGCLSLFPNSFISVGHDISVKNKFRKPNDTKPTPGDILLHLKNSDVDIKLVTTPGHTYGCTSLILSGQISFQNKICSKVVLAGDLWENENDKDSFSDFSENSEVQKISREYILTQKPDFIVPGHGPAFSLKK